MNFYLTLFNLLRQTDHHFYVGLPRDNRGNGFDPRAMKLRFAYCFCKGNDKKLARAKLVIHEAKALAREYSTNEPLEVPEVKRLMELFPNE